MGNRVGRHKKSKHERIRSKSVTQGGARSSNYRRKRSITRRMSSKSTPERLGVERKRYSDSQSVSLSSRLQQERHSLSQVSDFSISSNVFSKDDTVFKKDVALSSNLSSCVRPTIDWLRSKVYASISSSRTSCRFTGSWRKIF
eukprot:803560_1